MGLYDDPGLGTQVAALPDGGYQPAAKVLSRGPNANEIATLMRFINGQTGWPIPAAPPVKLRSIDDMTNDVVNAYPMRRGQVAYGLYDGNTVSLLDVWDRKNPQDMATLVRELARHMIVNNPKMPNTPIVDEDRLAAQAQESWLKPRGLSLRALNLSPGNLVGAR